MSRDPLGPDRSLTAVAGELDHLQDERRWLELLDRANAILANGASDALRCLATVKAAGALTMMERDLDALALLREHEGLLQAADEDLRSRWYVTAFRAHYRRGDLAAAETDALLGLASASLARDRAWLTAAAYGNLGLVAMRRAEWHTADRHLRTAVRMFTEVECPTEAVRYRANVAVSAYWMGDWDSALAEADATESVARHIDAPLAVARALITRAMILCARHERRACVGAVREALRLARREGFTREHALLREILGDLAADGGRWSAASRLYTLAREMGRADIPTDDVIFEAQRKLAEARRREGALDEARTLAAEALLLATRAGTIVEVGACERVLALALADLGEVEEARAHARAGIALLKGVRERYELFHLLRDTAPLLDDPTTMLWEAYFTADALGLVREAQELRATLLPRPLTRVRRTVTTGPTLHELQADEHRVFLTTDGRILRDVERAMRHPRCVLVEGETGTGKELIARYLHRHSPRATRPFMPLMCTEFLDRTFAYSALFGHRAGAFTGATHEQAGLVADARSGTLFFDEIADLPADVQGILLRFLQEGQYRRLGESLMRTADVWIIAASNRPLADRVDAGHFRVDLFYRLYGSVIRLPPLRERPEDILPLARYYLAKSAVACGRDLVLSPAAEDVLARYAWPGNVRELERLMELVASDMSGDGMVEPMHLDPAVVARASIRAEARSLWQEHHEQVRREDVAEALRAAGNNRTHAAQTLGISRRWLQKLIERYGLSDLGT